MLDFIVYQAYSGLLLSSIILLGSLIIQDSTQIECNKNTHFSKIIFWGALITITFIAAFFTRGNTILLGLFIPFIFIITQLKKSIGNYKSFNKFSFQSILYKTLAVWGISVIFSLVEFVKYYNFELGVITDVPHFDFLYYGKLSKYMVEYGIENRLFLLNQLIENSTSVRQPYHYPELWINGLLVKITGESSVQLLIFSTFPLLKAITCSTIYNLTIGNGKEYSKLRTILIVASIITISGFYFPFYNSSELLKYFDGITQAGILMAFGKKYVLIYLLATFSIFYYLNKEKYVEFLLLLSVIPLFSIGCLPSVCAIELLFPVYLIYTKKIGLKNLMGIYFNQLLIISFLGIYYSINGLSELNNTLSSSALISRIIQNPEIALFKSFFFSSFFSGLRFVLFFLPYFAILIFLRINKLKSLYNVGVLIISVMLGGLLAVGLSLGILDNGQFFYNSIPIIIILIAFEISKALNETPIHSIKITVIPITLLIFGFWHIYSNNEHEKKSNLPYNQLSEDLKLRNLNLFSKSNDKPIIGLFKATGLEKTNYSFLDSYYRNSHFYLQLLPNYQDAINIDITDFINPESKINLIDQYLIKQNEFYYYLEQTNQELSGLSLTSFARKIEASFFADGDSLYIINNLSDQELESLFNSHIRK
jgi:hypothetical protein